MANEHTERCWTSPILGDMQIRAVRRDHLTPSRTGATVRGEAPSLSAVRVSVPHAFILRLGQAGGAALFWVCLGGWHWIQRTE